MLNRILKVLLVACLLGGSGVNPARAQGFSTADDLLNLAASDDPTIVPNTNGGMAIYRPPVFSDMQWAIQHDARWLLAGGSHALGAYSRRVNALNAAADVFTDIGNSMQQILRFYSEYRRMQEIYGQIQSMAKFLDTYRLHINVLKFIPQIVITDPGDPMLDEGTPPARSFVVGFMPKHNPSWRNNADLYGDNPYWHPKAQGMSLIEVRYPHSWADIKIDASIWGGDDSMDELEFQKRLTAGLYDGVVSASRYLSGVGVDNNMESSVGRMSPRYFDMKIGMALDRRIAALKKQRAMYDAALADPNSAEGKAFGGLGVEELIRLQGAIDAEVASLEAKKSQTLSVETARNAFWVERGAFIHQVLAGLEAPERRIAIARLSERFKKYQNAWGNVGKGPDGTIEFMNAKPEITGDAKVDDAIYLIWQAITLMSGGAVPPPVPVSGGKAAEAQATLTKAMYRTFTYEELAGIRRLLGSEHQYKTQTRAQGDVDEMTRFIDLHIQRVEEGAIRLKQTEAINNAKDQMAAGQYGVWLKNLMNQAL